MIFVAGGAEERHTSSGYAIGPWMEVVSLTIDSAVKNTGNASYKYAIGTTAGSSPRGYPTAKSGCSFASLPWGRSNGTYCYLFQLTSSKWVGWYWAAGLYYIAVFDGTSGLRVATSTNGRADIAWTRCMWASDGTDLRMWSDISGTWQLEITYAGGGLIDRMGLNSSSNETKSGEPPRTDDVIGWDDQGDNWNSPIDISAYLGQATNPLFPRISAAHVPDLVSESDAGQATLIDEIPPDHTTVATVDSPNYWASFPTLLTTPQDLTAETIQAVMVTHVAGPAPDVARLSKFNVRENGIVYPNSEEGGRMIQIGYSPTPVWVTYAGYYPWTPLDESWTAALFSACDFGLDLINTKTDQITVQVIYFGVGTTDWEWTPPPSGVRRRLGLVT